nr:hypothetical protein [Ectobacillus panaciterrae]
MIYLNKRNNILMAQFCKTGFSLSAKWRLDQPAHGAFSGFFDQLYIGLFLGGLRNTFNEEGKQ